MKEKEKKKLTKQIDIEAMVKATSFGKGRSEQPFLERREKESY